MPSKQLGDQSIVLFSLISPLRLTPILPSRSSPILNLIPRPKLTPIAAPRLTPRPTPNPNQDLYWEPPRHAPVPSPRPTPRTAPGTLFELKGDYYEPVKIYGAFNDKFIKYKSNGDGNNALSMEGYLGKTRPFLPCMIDDLRISGAWKIHLTMKINFMSSKGCNEKHLVHSISNNDCKS